MLENPEPGEPLALVRGDSQEGGFLLTAQSGDMVLVPDEWRVPLAAHLLAGVSGLFDPQAKRRLFEVRRRMEKSKSRGVKRDQEKKDAEVLADLENALGCLFQEYLEADPKTSTKFHYRPEYYEDRRRKLVKAGLVAPLAEDRPPPVADVDDTPLPW